MTTEFLWNWSWISSKFFNGYWLLQKIDDHQIPKHFTLDFIIILQKFWLEFLWPSFVCCPTFKKNSNVVQHFLTFFFCCFYVVQHIRFSNFFPIFINKCCTTFDFFLFDKTFEFQSGGSSEVCFFQKKCRWMMHNLLN